MAEQRWQEGGGHLFRGSNFARKCISTTPIGAPILYLPLAPPLVFNSRLSFIADIYKFEEGWGVGRHLPITKKYKKRLKNKIK